jgi:hypothetical protein
MNLLILTTLPHYFAIYPIALYYTMYTRYYIHIIMVSSTLSIVYHSYNESNEFITRLDYIFAFLWAAFDLRMGYLYTNSILEILYLNLIVFIVNLYLPFYNLTHCLWHMLSAYKCFYISRLIQKGITQGQSHHEELPFQDSF